MVGGWFFLGRQRCVERRDHPFSYDVSSSTFVREFGRWHEQVLVRPLVEQILALMQAYEITEQVMLLPEKSLYTT
jgi:hypothetical protein